MSKSAIRNFKPAVGDGVAFEKIVHRFPVHRGAAVALGGQVSAVPATCLAITCPSGRRTAALTTFRKPCPQSNGLTWNPQGRLTVCEHATTRDAHRTDGRSTIIASHHDGKELQQPKRCRGEADGELYFTESIYRRKKYYGNPRRANSNTARSIARSRRVTS
jgi:sugar lactone lactonase YvrE